VLLSIIVPVYNCEKYISECLDSCLAQDISKNIYEIICIDDCSTDNSLSVIREYQKKNSNIHILHHESNSGVSAARNTGIEYAQGDYCWFVDGDDFIADNCLAGIKERLEVGCDMLTIGQATFQSEIKRERIEYVGVSNYRGLCMEAYLTNRVIKRSWIGDVRFQENVAYGEDEVFLLELMQKAPRIETLDSPIYFYRLHSASAMSFTPSKRTKRAFSVLNAAYYVRRKYAQSTPAISNFIEQRLLIAGSDIALLPFSQRISTLQKLTQSTSWKNILSSERKKVFTYFLRERLFAVLAGVASVAKTIKPIDYLYSHFLKGYFHHDEER